MDQLPNFVKFLFSLPDPETPKDGAESSSDGQSLPRQWPTPDAGVTTRVNRSASPNAATRPALARMAGGRNRLNPKFAAWLMGWPPSWVALTLLEPAEMASFLSRQRWHLSRLLERQG